MPPPGNYQIRTNSFVFTVRRFAERHAEVVVPYESSVAPTP